MTETEFLDILTHFRKNYWGNPISFFITGGGYSLFRLLEIPGGSRFIHKIIAPYSVEALQDFVIFYDSQQYKYIGKCSEEATRLYDHNLQTETTEDTTFVTANSALTTNRQRKGINRSHLIINDVYSYLEFPTSLKPEDYSYYPERVENERRSQDFQLSAHILNELLRVQ